MDQYNGPWPIVLGLSKRMEMAVRGRDLAIVVSMLDTCNKDIEHVINNMHI